MPAAHKLSSLLQSWPKLSNNSARQSLGYGESQSGLRSMISGRFHRDLKVILRDDISGSARIARHHFSTVSSILKAFPPAEDVVSET